jgi:hypothetical protein
MNEEERRVESVAHTFTIVHDYENSTLVKKVESAVISSGGGFEGDEKSGSFSGKTPLGLIKAEYCCTSANEVRVTIVDKPFLVPYSVIESKMREYFG